MYVWPERRSTRTTALVALATLSYAYDPYRSFSSGYSDSTPTVHSLTSQLSVLEKEIHSQPRRADLKLRAIGLRKLLVAAKRREKVR